VLAANTIRDRFGVGVGDGARLRTDEGFRDFEVGAVVVDYTGGGEAFVASIADLPLFGGGSPDLFVLTVLPGEDPMVVRAPAGRLPGPAPRRHPEPGRTARRSRR
jgi:putative ABC transport system permease protein